MSRMSFVTVRSEKEDPTVGRLRMVQFIETVVSVSRDSRWEIFSTTLKPGSFFSRLSFCLFLSNHFNAYRYFPTLYTTSCTEYTLTFQNQWRSQGLSRWATRSPRGPKWGREWEKFEENKENWSKFEEKKVRKVELLPTRDCEAGYCQPCKYQQLY